jgi:hypothetical protein
MTSWLQAPSGSLANPDGNSGMNGMENAEQILGSAMGLMATEGAALFEEVGESGDPMEAYFECITTCSLDDGECITECTEILRQGV